MRNLGFTLIELSIVLIIISLIIGSTLIGVSLVGIATQQTVINEYSQNRYAINAFLTQYGQYPGDFINATNYWYNVTTCPGTAGTAGSCNGNFNGLIEYTGGTNSDEGIRAWQHLNLANIIPGGSYTGIHATAGTNVLGSTIPQSKKPPNGWTFTTTTTATTVPANFLQYGAIYNGTTVNAAALTVPDASDIDRKIDDGLPNTGLVQSQTLGSGATTCVSGAAYNVLISNTTPYCVLAFKF